MRRLFVIFLMCNMYCCQTAAAHPVDDLCVNNIWNDKCQPPVAALGFDKPEFFAAHKSYWHCRRSLVVQDIVPYGSCSGAVAELEDLLNVPQNERYWAEPGVLSYWNEIPAHPELDYPGEAWRPLQQLKACNATRELFGTNLFFCTQRLWELRKRMDELLERPPVVVEKVLCCDKKRKNCKVC